MRGNFRMLRRTVEKRRNLYYNFLENEKNFNKTVLMYSALYKTTYYNKLGGGRHENF